MARPIRKTRSLSLAIFLLAVLIIVVRAWFGPDAPTEPLPITAGMYEVVRVVDGDTVILRYTSSEDFKSAPQHKGHDFRVRLMGVDTPETVHPDKTRNHEPFGKEATEFTKKFLAVGKVRLELDKERIDRYGRYLGYLYVDQAMLNEELVKAGLARAKLQYRYAESKKKRFKRAEQTAKENKVGIWSLKKAS